MTEEKTGYDHALLSSVVALTAEWLKQMRPEAAIAGVGETAKAFYTALRDMGGPASARLPEGTQMPSSAAIRKSITPDALISFEDGKGYKSLKRTLSIRGLTPDQYRAKWGLPSDYPMVSPNYSAQRSALAHKIGLGKK